MTSNIDSTRRRLLGTAALTAFSALPLGLLRSSGSGLPIEGDFASLKGATGWLNSDALENRQLRGKVVLIGFWTYSCINWRRTLPYLRTWHEKYKQSGLTVIGVHSPEFAFERSTDNVRRAAQTMRIEYPIALDNDFGIWRAFDNQYWPALYFVDAKGRIRHHEFGEGNYVGAEQVLQELLRDNGIKDLPTPLVSINASGPELAADWSDLKSAENYLGHERTVGFESPDGATLNRLHSYKTSSQLKLNHWALSGDWTLSKQSIVSGSHNARIAYQFHSRDLHIVMGPGAAIQGSAVRFQIFIDGEAPRDSHGLDVDREGFGSVDEPRMYQIVRQAQPVGERRFEISFIDAGVQAYSFTFG